MRIGGDDRLDAALGKLTSRHRFAACNQPSLSARKAKRESVRLGHGSTGLFQRDHPKMRD